MKLVFDESYGELSFTQRAAYRKYGVSPADHWELCEQLGETNHDKITKTVKANSSDGMYISPFLFNSGQQWKIPSA
jgi:hypothetical protein